jgi:hypothetical protein
MGRIIMLSMTVLMTIGGTSAVLSKAPQQQQLTPGARSLASPAAAPAPPAATPQQS